MRKKLTDNLIKSWKTTIIGTAILIAALFSVFIVPNLNWFDASIGIGIGLALLFSPDSIIKRVNSLFRKSNSTPCQ